MVIYCHQLKIRTLFCWFLFFISAIAFSFIIFLSDCQCWYFLCSIQWYYFVLPKRSQVSIHSSCFCIYYCCLMELPTHVHVSCIPTSSKRLQVQPPPNTLESFILKPLWYCFTSSIFPFFLPFSLSSFHFSFPVKLLSVFCVPGTVLSTSMQLA